MKTEEKSIFHGDNIWKSAMEYHNEHTFLHGFPFYRITRIGDTYYLWELDLNDPDACKYQIMKESDDFNPLYEEGLKLGDAIGQKYRAMNLYNLSGKELVEKLNLVV